MLVDRLIPKGLRWRLAGAVATVMVISFAITFLAVYRGTGSELRKQIDGEINGDANELSHALAVLGQHSPPDVAKAATRYVRSQPFSPSSTLLFALVPGAGVSTNRPELFGSPQPDHGESETDQLQENQLAQRLVSSGDGFHTLALPDVGDLRLLKRVVKLPGGLGVTVGVGEPLASVAHAQRGVARSFILAGILTLAGALAAAYLLGTRFSRPLRMMAAVATRVDGGDLHPRIHGLEGHGEEVRVLADAFNHMLARLTEAFASQRAFVADASHELRTPLTVIRGQLELLASQPDPSGEEVRRVEARVQSEIARITRLVDDLLLLAKAEQTEFLKLAEIDLRSYVLELWDGTSSLGSRNFELGSVPDGRLWADPDRLAQALRNLITNAIEHTEPERGHVRLSVDAVGAGRIRFTVADDGPGIPEDQLERVFDRFHRTDSARDRASGGTGLGLAIVRAIVEAHDGRVSARAGVQGAHIELELPGFTEPGVGGVDRATERDSRASPPSRSELLQP
jgi:two-component system OmpR family sensor kinase